jgi:hypothetical protein
LEGKGIQRADALFNKSEAVCCRAEAAGGDFSWPALEVRGESACTLTTNAVEGLLTGRGGEEEPGHVVISASACWRSYPCCL